IKDFTYITDVNHIPEEEFKKIEGTRFLILDALQKADHISHYNLEQAVAVCQRIQPEKAYFTHISHRMGLHAAVEKELPDNIHLSYDGLVIDC
ncbi:MAG: MBL fold metallo-hydrolase, partial [Bacteroidota bacterium]